MIKKSFLYFLGKGMAALLSFFFLPVFTHYLAPDEFGIVTLILITITYGSTIFSFGLNTGYMIRYYKSADVEKRAMFSIVLLAFSLIVPITMILSPFFRVLAPVFDGKLTLTTFYLLGLTIWFSVNLNFFTALLRNQLRAGLFVVFTVGNSLITNLLTLYLLQYHHLGVMSFFYALLFSNFIFNLMALPVFFRFFKIPNLKNDLIYLKQLIKISWPVLPTQVFSNILNSGDRYILKYFKGEKEVGLYSIGFRFGTLVNSFLLEPFLGTYIPRAYELYVKDKEAFVGLQRRTLSLVVFFYTFFVILISIPFEFAFKKLIASTYYAGYPVIGLVLIAYLFAAIPNILVVVQTMMEKLHFSLWITIFTTMVYLVLNFLLIPFIGFYGAATAFVFTNLISLVLIAKFNQRLMYIPYSWFSILLTITIGIATVLAQHILNIAQPLLGNIIIKSCWGFLGAGLCILINRIELKPIFIIGVRKLVPFFSWSSFRRSK